MIGRLLRGGFMTAIYAYLYIPIIILIVNSFNSSRFGINWQVIRHEINEGGSVR